MRRNCVKVCIRTRPTQNFAQDQMTIDTEHNTIQVNMGGSAGDGEGGSGGILNNKQNSFKFRFDHVFHNSSQQQVYDLYCRDTVQSVVDGINGSIMSYGQTGSGKTFTMSGDVQNYEHRGVAPRALNQLFNEINSRIEFEFRVSCTYMEIYNERIFDLLTDLASPDQAADFTIAEEKDGRGTFVRGLTEVEVKDENGALSLLFSGGLSRTIATHKLNKRSNRSHSIFTVYVQQRLRSGVSEKVVHSKLHLIDLAGSERLKKTMDSMDGSVGDDVTRKESMAINQSLTYLEQCVVALARRNQTHIPYRQSKLTNILKDSLGANCNTVMVACVWGEAAHLEETVSTLRLASRMMRVENETASVETIDPSALIRKQEKIIRALKQELLMHDALVERTGVAYDPYTPEQQEQVSQMIERYTDAAELDEESVLSISNYRQMIEICKQFKKKLLSARADARAAHEQALLGTYGGGAPGTRGRSAGGAGGGGLGSDSADFAADSKLAVEFDPSSAQLVGETTSERKGFSLGVSGADHRPPGGIEGVSRMAESKGGGGGFGGGAKSLGSPVAFRAGGGGGDFGSPTRSIGGGGGSADFLPDSPFGDANYLQFESFSRGEGRELYLQYSEARVQYKEARNRGKELTAAVNDAKAAIDRLLADIEVRKASRIELLKRPGGVRSQAKDEIIDDEEFRLSNDLKEAKRAYKNGFEQMQRYKSQAVEMLTRTEQLKADMTVNFNRWMAANTNTRGGGGAHSPVSTRNFPSFGGTGDSAFGGGGGGGGGGGPGDGGDQLDDQEAFDRLEVERVLANDPESLAFFQAQKTRKANMTQNVGNIRQIQKNKRFA